jgi:hypothetical protein
MNKTVKMIFRDDTPIVGYINKSNRANIKPSFTSFLISKLQEEKSGFYLRDITITNDELRTMKKRSIFSSDVFIRWCEDIERYISFQEKV